MGYLNSLRLVLLAAQDEDKKNLPTYSGCLQARRSIMLALRELKNDLLSALPCAVGLV